MLQFEVRRLAHRGAGRKANARVVVLQHELSFGLDTRLVAPLRALDELPALGRMRPDIVLGRKRFRLIVDRLNVVRTQDLVERVGTAQGFSEQIKRALDELFYGI